MTKRQRSNLLSALFFVAFAMVAGGTGYPPEDPIIGTFPLSLETTGDRAYLLYETRGPHGSDGQYPSSFHFTTLDTAGRQTLLGSIDAAVPFFLGAVTADSDGAIAVVMKPTTDGTRTFVLTDRKTGIIENQDHEWSPSRYFASNARLALRRTGDRHIAWFSEGVVQPGKGVPSLWEVEDGRLRVLQASTVWAYCNASLCQHVAYTSEGGKRLRLYAWPATSQEPNFVAEEIVEDEPYFRYFDDIGPDGKPRLTFGSAMYALSTTRPSLKRISRLDESAYSYSYRRDPNTRQFSDGLSIELSTENDIEPRSGFCDASCRENYTVLETWVTIRSRDGGALLNFPIEDL